MRPLIPAVLAVALIAAAGTAGAQPATAPPARSADASALVARLFVETCIQFAGNAAELRAGLAQHSVPALPSPVADIFLGGRTGAAYDTSIPTARLALVSADDGSCSAYAETADPAQVIAGLEADLQQAGLSPALSGESADPQNPALHHRDYRVTIGGRPWVILMTSTAAPGQIQAVLTLRPAQ